MNPMERQPKPQNMGEATSEAFAGKADTEVIKKLYTETPALFAEYINNEIPSNKPLKIADIGSASGEMASNMKKLLPDHDVKIVAVDIDEKALANNPADEKHMANAENLPFEKVDVAVMRYVLQWNNPERQKNILKELSTHVSEFALIEHAGSDPDDPEGWRDKMNALFAGKQVPQLKRDEHFFSSKLEVEGWMNELGIQYKALRQRRVENVSQVFIKRWNLNEHDALEVKRALEDKDYVFQTDWVVFPSKD